ncbi:Signal-peptide peptidase, presenilin aspartyl protease [Natronorubrum sediminis]|uniref:Signal-peptide peptidase, presenilin aspartyl protease n=1 Tax=Natronorubrum sediminis TaxID=640943 RepID=A0A1H6FIU4_9EURY|nr:presenilin family intramembrane aspartyl protease PSH [Natronorubrum sediminis]SEH10756.1 Signal-peptide peptidase, presenilin aspartyl protease [Natronorubrum sediminis]
MNHRTRVSAAVGFTVALFLAIQLGTLALVEPFQEAGHQAVDDPDDPANSAFYFGIILVATAFMLLTFKYNADWLIRALIVGVSVMLGWFVFAELVPPVVTVASTNVLAALGALAVGAALLVYPEWYVIDATGIVLGAGAAALFGISFGLLPAILLLSILAIYDAISVYRTEHMLDLAEGVMDLKIPVVLVVPTTLSYSYLEAGSTEGVTDVEDGHPSDERHSTDDEDSGTAAETEPNPATESEADADLDTETDANLEAEGDSDLEVGSGSDGDTDAEELSAEERERDALFIGLGDAVIPTILVASAAYFLEAGTIDVPGLALNVPALGAIIGTIAGLLVLMYMVLKGRPHAGLPLLNGGAIGGYLLGAIASGLSISTALGF